MDEGWTEWLFDTYGFKYTLITPADLRAGNLARASTRSCSRRRASAMPGAAGVAAAVVVVPPVAAGGRGNAAADSAAAQEVAALDEFVKGGGTVVAWNQGATSIVERAAPSRAQRRAGRATAATSSPADRSCR